MRVSYNWLKDYVKISLGPSELAERLTMAGLEVTAMEEVAGDQIMDIEVTTNRPDCLSILGVAREVGAITGRRIELPDLSFTESDEETSDLASVKIEDSKGCPRYTARVITDLKVKPSPKWLKDRLTALGTRPVNLIVDITNFVLLELGQPLHAFDYDKLAGGQIIVRRAKKGETLLTIDWAPVELSPEILVIAGKSGPVALAGIMGGRHTEVSESTKTILLESAYFDPVVTRKAARSLGTTTESSYRFERGVDPEGVLKASDRACNLLKELAGATIAKGAIDIGEKVVKSPRLTVRPSWVNQVLGTKIPKKDMEGMLTSLGLSILSSDEDMMKVEPPSYRQDLARPIDLVEEVARLYGYQNITPTSPRVTVTEPHKDLARSIEPLVKETLTSCGLSEVVTYSLISKESLSKARLPGEEVVSIKNPLSLDQEILRPTLLPGILEAVVWNKNRNVTDVKIFELGRVYHPEKKGRLPREVTNLACALSGKVISDWRTTERPIDFYDLKGVIEVLMARIGCADYEIAQTRHPSLHPARSAVVSVKGTTVGFLGEASREVVAGFDLAESVWISELRLYDLTPHISPEKLVKTPPKYPSITLDIAIAVKDDVPSKAITSIIHKTGGELIKGLKLFDLYRGPQVPAGHKSLAYSIEYQALDRTLTYEEARSVHSRIGLELKNQLGAGIR